MKLKDMFRSVVREVLPHKSLEQVVERQNTRTVWYPRVWSLPRKYVYGKCPGEPLMEHDWHPEGQQHPKCRNETDPDVIQRHIAICRGTEGSHGGLCEMCRKLNNPNRLDFLIRLYRDIDTPDFAGFNVNGAREGSKLNQPATSEYLRQLADLRLARRERVGRQVIYRPDFTRAAIPIAEIATMIAERVRGRSDDVSFGPIFRVMMGSVRSRVVRHIASGESGGVEFLCERFGVRESDLHHALRPAIDADILSLDMKCLDGTYRYITPADPIARRIVELS